MPALGLQVSHRLLDRLATAMVTAEGHQPHFPDQVALTQGSMLGRRVAQAVAKGTQGCVEQTPGCKCSSI